MLPCRLAVVTMMLLLAGCSAAREESRIAAMVPLDATVASFDVCHGTSCTVRTPVGLSDEQWERITEVFARSAKSAAAERQDIAHAIALFERFVGEKTGTMHDVGGNLAVADQAGQLDCIDESVNTTTYLRLLKDADLLQWHDVAFPAHRNPNLIDFHNTAVIIERDNRMYWAVDSWFRPNAHDPYIVPLTAWYAGWRPGDGTLSVSTAPSETPEPDDTEN